jgi:hypothetical protein
MKRFLPLLAILLVQPAAVFAQDEPDAWIETSLAYSRNRIGQPDRYGWQIVDARAEGRTLVLVFAPPADGSGRMSAEDYGISVAAGMCQTPDGAGFFANGRALRVDIREGAQPRGSVTVGACPGPAAATRIMARNIQRLAGQPFGPLTLTGARAEGTELVILMDGPAGWRRDYPPARINNSLFPSFCRNPDTEVYFDGIRTIRIDTLERGRNARRGLPITSCAPFRGG